MAITVKLTDATVQVGGDFSSALASVKSFAGRKYDAATKVWTLPTTVQEFRRRCSLPLDIAGNNDRVGNGHVTRYGSYYSRNEWQAVKETPIAVAEATASFGAQYATLEQELTKRVAALGFTQATLPRLVGIMTHFELEDREECGQVRYTSREREQAVHAVYDWYGTEWKKIHDVEQDAAWKAEEDVLVRFGVVEPR